MHTISAQLAAFAKLHESGCLSSLTPGMRARPAPMCSLHQARARVKNSAPLVRAVSPKPVNVLVGSNIGLTVADLAELGVRRISVGSTLARTAWGNFMRAAKAIAEEGSFAGFDGATPFAELNGILE